MGVPQSVNFKHARTDVAGQVGGPRPAPKPPPRAPGPWDAGGVGKLPFGMMLTCYRTEAGFSASSRRCESISLPPLARANRTAPTMNTMIMTTSVIQSMLK